MILLTCGVPGAGKTLWTVNTVEARRIAETRPVFYSGIAGCALEWTELGKGDDWDTVPDGSIVVVDEAQRLFPVRKQGAAVPEVIRRMETHRHRGIDLYLVSQNPLQLDTAVRHLVGEYRFLSRPFGHAYSVIWRFAHVCDWRSTTERQTVVKERWKFPAASFGWYRSAELHTHKKTFPKFLLWGLPLVAVIGGCVFLLWKALHHAPGAAVAVSSAAAPSGNAPGAGGPLLTRAEWDSARSTYVQQRTPRIREMPESAPVYDQLAVPVTFPRVAMCVAPRKGICRCYTQQATPVPVLDSFCGAFVRDGAFDPYRAALQVAAVGGDAQAEGKPGAPGGGVAGKPLTLGLAAKAPGVPAKPVPAVDAKAATP